MQRIETNEGMSSELGYMILNVHRVEFAVAIYSHNKEAIRNYA